MLLPAVSQAENNSGKSFWIDRIFLAACSVRDINTKSENKQQQQQQWGWIHHSSPAHLFLLWGLIRDMNVVSLVSCPSLHCHVKVQRKVKNTLFSKADFYFKL